MQTVRSPILAGLVLLVGGCSSSGGGADARLVREAPAADALRRDAPSRPVTFGGARPVQLDVPTSYDPATPTPLLIVLHGYGANGYFQITYFGLRDLYRGEKVLVLAPNGTEDSTQKRFWNATNACCDFEGKGVDDVAYLTGLVSEVSQHYNVDPKRVYAIGHSNGGFMAHRLACDRAMTFAAIISLAGAMPDKAADCQPKDKVSVLQIHGDNDQSVLFAGGSALIGKGQAAYPGAKATVARWAAHDGCGADLVPGGETLDLEATITGSETTVARHACPTGVDAELWVIVGGPHVPLLTEQFAARTWQWLKNHARP